MYILKKNVDYSLLTSGITLPVNTFDLFWRFIGRELYRGEYMDINIVIDDQTYQCRLYNVDFNKKRKDVLQLRYSSTSPIAIKLQSVFFDSYNYLKKQRALPENKNKSIRLPQEVNEYIVMSATGIRGTFVIDYFTDNDNRSIYESINHIDEYLFENDNFGFMPDPTAGYVEVEKVMRVRKLNRNIADELKLLYDYRCQISGARIGNEYGCSVVEAHHIDYFTKSLNNDTSNIIIISPSFHRIIHQTSPEFDRKSLSFIFPNGVVEKVKLDKHLNCE